MKLLIALSISFMLLFSVAFSLDISAQTPDNSNDDWVYLIKSHNPVLKDQLGARHNFDVGFTSTLNEHQVAGLEKAGFALERVELYQITAPPGACSPWPSCKGGGDDPGDTTRKHTPSDPTPWGIEKIYNDNSITSTNGGLGIDVAVLDSGIHQTHPDLERRIVECVDFTGSGDCGDKNGHGTHVAGTIAADGGADGLGIYGVAPQVNIHAYKVCKQKSCWGDDVAAAINFAGSNGAEIVSMSLGGFGPSSLILGAISNNPHVLFVASAGNDGPSIGSIVYPGASANVVAVGAIDTNENVPSWSSRGINDGDYVIEEREVEVGAPGVSVESTWKSGRYNTISGTSMAAPHISGLAAKLWQGDASSTRTHIQDLAKLHDLYTVGDDPATGFGLPQIP